MTQSAPLGQDDGQQARAWMLDNWFSLELFNLEVTPLQLYRKCLLKRDLSLSCSLTPHKLRCAPGRNYLQRENTWKKLWCLCNHRTSEKLGLQVSWRRQVVGAELAGSSHRLRRLISPYHDLLHLILVLLLLFGSASCIFMQIQDQVMSLQNVCVCPVAS